MAKTSHIYYLLGYDPENKKWYSADELLCFMTSSGQVLEAEDDSEEPPKWRSLEDGLETDIDFDNTELLSQFLKKANEET